MAEFPFKNLIFQGDGIRTWAYHGVIRGLAKRGILDQMTAHYSFFPRPVLMASGSVKMKEIFTATAPYRIWGVFSTKIEELRLLIYD